MPSRSQQLRNISLFAVVLLVSSALALAASITGVVTDRTTNKPSASDTIAVINTAQSMDEIAKATSDGQGRFHVNVPDGGQILLHITHRGAEYFKSVPQGMSSVDIDVYDSAQKIDGISGEAMVLRAETDASGKTLSVVENLFLQNSSSPPRTQFGGNTIDFYLPRNAVVSESLASAPGGLPTNSKMIAVDAGSGHYAFTFPIRPGETRFQVTYTLPYNGRQPFSLKLSVPTGDVAVMLPKAMQFQGSTQFQPINDASVVNSQSFDAHNPPFAQPVEFTIAGTGQLPQTQDAAQGNGDQSGNGGQPSTATTGARPGGGLGAPIDPEGTNDTLSKYKWWILGGLGLALAAGAGVMLKSGQPNPAVAVGEVAPLPFSAVPVTASVAPAVVSVATSGPGPLLNALKEELFELETDRLTGRVSESQYAEQKAALEVVLRRALKRIEAAPAASNG